MKDIKIETYTEKDYWEGKVPDELFDDYLERYGYEYTPTSHNGDITIEIGD
tara:strand:- start:383 stop:535 length:153 start_codon:yes stop_codon:yes gene_type:complete